MILGQDYIQYAIANLSTVVFEYLWFDGLEGHVFKIDSKCCLDWVLLEYGDIVCNGLE